MSALWLLFKSAILTICILNILQAEWRGEKLETYLYSWITFSETTKPIRNVATQTKDIVIRMSDTKPEKNSEGTVVKKKAIERFVEGISHTIKSLKGKDEKKERL